ncbi:hypothetical protein HNP00_003542 [Arthrobacter sp. AZCC_0090]|nr:hypothetical protein [Arthrobacter sp. AZCC_0090]
MTDAATAPNVDSRDWWDYRPVFSVTKWFTTTHWLNSWRAAVPAGAGS